MMNHAFLVMAHNNYPLLGRILRKLDHPKNTIYLHIDAKSKFCDEDLAMLQSCCSSSALHLVQRHNVVWGGYNQIHCELRLLEAAVRDQHDYYHFISGVDFPIKPMNDIHRFFTEHNGQQFVHFCDEAFTKKQHVRFSLNHYFIEKCGRNRKKLLWWVEQGSLFLQKNLLRIDLRRKHPQIQFQGGGFWCSLSHDFAQYLLDQEALVQELFKNSVCGDEHYIQTILFNSPYADTRYDAPGYDACLRSIDWDRAPAGSSSPYTYSVDDFDALVASPNLFCRKISDATPDGEALIRKLEEL